MLDLKANEPAYLNATIRFSQPGSYQVQATARKVVSQDAVWGDLKVLFITVG
jgi:predicted PolB exonuclease-like 3'-5' exonuclease